jgi:hypothetical protein
MARMKLVRLASLLLCAFLGACSHVSINASSNTSSGAASPPPAGTSVTSGSTGLQAQSDSRALVGAILIMSIAAAVIDYSREPRPFPSSAALIPENLQPAPGLARERRINEQDCTRPLDLFAGNLRCR